MDDFKGHDCLVSSDIWSSYGNWESNCLQPETLEPNLSKDLIIDPNGRHSKKEYKMEIRRTKDRIRKRILRARETPLASAIRREKNRRRMAVARARKSMQWKTVHHAQESKPEVTAEVSLLKGIAFGPSEVAVDSLSQSSSLFNRERLPNDCSSSNVSLERGIQTQSESLVFSQLQDLHPVELHQNGKIDSRITQTSKFLPITIDDDDERTRSKDIAEDAFYQPLLDAISFEKKTEISQIKKTVLPNVPFSNEVRSSKCNETETMHLGIQLLAKNNAIMTAPPAPPLPPPPPPPPPLLLQSRKTKISTNCTPSQITVANESPNVDSIPAYQPSSLSTGQANQNQSQRGIREINRQSDHVVSNPNTNAHPATAELVTNTPGGLNCTSLRHRRKSLMSIEMRRKRDRLRKQVIRARESQLEKDIRREKNRKRMADMRARHRLKSSNTQMRTEHETTTTAATGATWNPTWKQYWMFDDATLTNQGNGSSNLTPPLETPLVLPKERRTFVVPNHLESFMSNLSSLWKDGRLCDASISNGTTEIMIHKMVLAAVCPKILTELSKTPLDKFQKVTFPNSVSKEALTAFAEYMYSGVLDLDEIILAQLKIIAQRLDMKDFEQLCESHVQSVQLVPARIDPTFSNEIQAATIGLQAQAMLQNDLTPVIKQVPVDGQNNNGWPSPASNILFPVANPASNEGMLKIKQELSDSAMVDNGSKPRIKKEPVTFDDTTFRGAPILLHNRPTRPQRSLPHVESLISISPLRAKKTNSNPVTTCLNSLSATKMAGARFVAPNITLHRNNGNTLSPHSASSSSHSALSSSHSASSLSSSSSFNSNTSSSSSSSIYSQTDNSQVNLLGHYVSQISEADESLTKPAYALASLTSGSDVGNPQTMSIKLPSPLSFYNMT